MENNRVLELLLWLQNHLSDYQKSAVLPTNWSLKDELDLAIRKKHKHRLILQQFNSSDIGFQNFEANVEATTSLGIQDFKKGSLVESLHDGAIVNYYNGKYVLSIDASNPYWELFELENYIGPEAKTFKDTTTCMAPIPSCLSGTINKF